MSLDRMGVSHQVMLAMFGAQHGRHLLQVGGVAALLCVGGEGEGDDPLCDVDQIHLIALLHGLNHNLTPGGEEGCYKFYAFNCHSYPGQSKNFAKFGLA